MTEKRYRYDTGSIIDTKEHKVLTVRQAVNRLNKQDEEIKELKEAMKRLMADMMCGGK